MKNTRKGLTLVEIIVAIAVFSIVSVAFFTSYVSMNKVVARQEEYTRFEMICYDINYYWDMYGFNEDSEESWEYKYFKSEIEENNGKYVAYFDKDFKPKNNNDDNKAVYKITFSYSGTDNKSLTIDKIEKLGSDKKVIVEDVKCGEQWEKGVTNEN